jgi:pimeloyl-ACP methyl ester carboxylesterase
MLLSGELLQGGEKWCNRLQKVAVPTLIIHGTEDCVLPYAYSLALQAEIQGAVMPPTKGTDF